MSASVFDGMRELVAAYGPDGALVYVNPAMGRRCGRAPADLVGQDLRELFPGPEADELRAAIGRVAPSGAPEDVTLFHASLGAWYEHRLSSAEGRAWVISHDVTDHRLATARLEALAGASHVVATSSWEPPAFDAIARHVAEALHDACILRLRAPDGATFEAPVGVWDVDAEVRAVLAKLPAVAAHEGAGREVFRTGRGVLVAQVEPTEIAARIAPEDGKARVEALGIHSLIIAPMRAQGEILGLVSVVRRRSGTPVPFAAADLELLEELADRAALVESQRRTFRLLEDSRRTLRELVENTPYAVAMFDRQMRYVYASKRWLTDFSLPLGSDEIRGMSHYEVFPEIPAHWKEVHRRALAGETSRQDAERFVRADGTILWTRWEVRPWHDDAGEVAGILVFREDIGDRRRSETELLRWEQVFQHASWGMSLATPDNRFILVNRAFAAMHGTEPEDWKGRPLVDMFDEASKAMLPRLAAEVHATGHVVYESMHLRADGTTFPVLAEVTAFKDEAGHVLYRAANFQDITERKRAEQALRESQELYRSTFDNAAVGIAHVGLDGRWLMVNDRMCAITGYRRDELLATDFQSITHPDDLAADLSLVEDLISGRRSSYTMEKRYLHKSGGHVWVSLTVSALRAPGGAVSTFIAVIEDITLRKQAEVALRESEDTLRRAVALRDDFLSVASHELRTPLTALALQLDAIALMLARPAAGDDRPKLARKVGTAIRQADRLNALVAGLLDVSRIAQGRARLDLEEVDVVALVQEVVERFEEEALRAGSSVELRIPAGLDARWDRMRVDQVLTNLLGNAIKYGAGKPIVVEVTATGEQVTLAVADQGIGLSETDAARIFGRFERAVSPDHYGGLGLGLFIAREIAAAHGGSITVESAEKKGARFAVALPRRVGTPSS